MTPRRVTLSAGEDGGGGGEVQSIRGDRIFLNTTDYEGAPRLSPRQS